MNNIKSKVRHIIFDSDTRPARLFDVLLLWAIILSVLVVMLDSVPSIRDEYHFELYAIEWVLTILFSIEYVLRIWTINKSFKYIFSFYGMIDLLSVLPTYLSILITGSSSLMVIRTLRLMRVFRILRLVGFVKEAKMLVEALKQSRYKLTVFFGFVFSLTVIIGTVMYLIEGPENGFTSIPVSIYWTIVTLTTVGYGDIAPHTILGQSLASLVMLLGYTIIAIPTGIVSVSFFQERKEYNTRTCSNCSKEGHDGDAQFCKFCGSPMPT